MFIMYVHDKEETNRGLEGHREIFLTSDQVDHRKKHSGVGLSVKTFHQ